MANEDKANIKAAIQDARMQERAEILALLREMEDGSFFEEETDRKVREAARITIQVAMLAISRMKSG